MLKYYKNSALYIAAILISIIPLLMLNTPPLVDYGGHLGRMAIQLDNGQSEHLNKWYSFTWGLIPNLGTDILVQLLSPWMALEPSLKLILIATVAIQASGYIYLSRVVHGTVSPTVFLALPLVYNYTFHFGFLNFLFATAITTWAIALWIQLGAKEYILRRAMLFAAIAPMIWVSHMVGWALLLIYAGSDELVRNYKKHGKSFKTIGACILPCLALLTPLFFYAFGMLATSESGESAQFFRILHKVGFLFQAVRDNWALWDILAAFLFMACIIWMCASKYFSLHAGLALGASILFVIFLIMPGRVIGSAFADMRLAPVILATAIIAAQPNSAMPRQKLKLLTALALSFFSARTLGTAISLHQEDARFQEDLAILDNIPRGTNLISFYVKPCSKLYNWDPQNWHVDRRAHIASYAIARRHAFTNDQWVMPGGQLLRLNNPAAAPFESDPSNRASIEGCKRFPSLASQLAQFPETIDYLWLIGSPESTPMHGWQLSASSGRSYLYIRSSSQAN